jgi:hypothetical protein
MVVDQQANDVEWVRTRPVAAGYGIPASDDGMLEFPAIEERLAEAKNYWICTASVEGQPHGVPVWAAWVDGAIWFGGGPRTSRNLAANPRISVHLESGSEVVILEGEAQRVESPDPGDSQAIDDQCGAKYDWRPSSEGSEPVGKGWYRLEPSRVIAWTQFPADATRWTRQGKEGTS